MEAFGIQGETILEYSIYDALRAGFDHIICVIRKDFENEFRESLLPRLPSEVRVSLAFQEIDKLPVSGSVNSDRRKPWGTGHAVWVAKDVVDGPFGVINADDFYGPQAYKLLAEFLKNPENSDNNPSRKSRGLLLGLVGYHLEKTLSDFGPVSRGICVFDSKNLLRGINELGNIEKSPAGPLARESGGGVEVLDRNILVSMNMFGFQPEVFDYLESQLIEFIGKQGHDPKAEFYIPLAVTRMMEEGHARVKIIPTEEKWFGITYPQDKPNVISALTQRTDAGIYPNPLWK